MLRKLEKRYGEAYIDTIYIMTPTKQKYKKSFPEQSK